MINTVHENGSVLVVEDHDDTACLLRFILEREGYGVTHICDGRTAQELIATTPPPDLLLLDIMLPSVTGLNLLRAVRTTPEWQWIPVILLTADTRSETMTEAANPLSQNDCSNQFTVSFRDRPPIKDQGKSEQI